MVTPVRVVNHSRTGIEVHKVGCADIAKSKRRGLVNSDWSEPVPDGADIATTVVAALNASFGWPNADDPTEPAPWSVSDVRVFPCVKG